VRDLAKLSSLVGRHRLVTLVGAPGCGKTRLAEELGARLVGRYADGVWAIDLAAVSHGGDIEETLAGVLEIPNESAAVTSTLVRDYLRDKQSLLILDNCEYQASSAVDFASDVLGRCPRLHIVATSREPLRMDGELVWPVLPLRVPPPASKPRDVFRYEAAELWLDRVRRLRPAFDPSQDVRPEIAELCRRLDGIPLGLELAAGWSVVFTPREVLRRLDTRAESLTDRTRSEDDRHSSLHSAISWSHSQLSDAAGSTFRALGLFQGACHLDAVACAGDLPEEEAAVAVAELVDKSLVTVGGGSDDGSTYGMLMTIREFAMTELRASGAEPAVRDRYIDHYLRVGERTASVVGFVHGVPRVRQLETEYANVDRALALASSTDPERASRLTAALCPYWEYRHRPDPALRWLTEVVARRRCDPRTLSTCLSWLAVMMMWKRPDRAPAALDVNEEGLRLALQLGDPELLATVQQHRALILNQAGRLTEASAVAADAARLAAAAGCGQQLALCVFRLGAVALTGGDVEGAHPELTRSLAMARELGYIQLQTLALSGLSRTNVLLGRHEEAQTSIEECLRSHEALTPRQFTILVETMAAFELARARKDRAAIMLDVARKLRVDYSLPLSESWRPREDQADQRRARRGSRAPLAPGAGLDREALAGYLLQLVSTPRASGRERTAEPARRLTGREREVADLLRQGLTNRQIAERLSIAERTAEGHVERLRRKLGVHSRSEIAGQVELVDRR